MHTFDKDLFFEKLNDRIDKPIDYNHLLAHAVSELIELIEDQTAGIIYQDGFAYHLHPDIGKTLSFEKQIITATDYGKVVTDRYLRVGRVPTQGEQGVLMPRDGTILGIRAKCRNDVAWTLEVRKNGAPINVASISIVNGEGYVNLVDIDFDEGDYLQIYLNGTGVSYPITQVEVAWRI